MLGRCVFLSFVTTIRNPISNLHNSIGPANYAFMNLGAMSQYVDYFNLMAYDYAGAWDTVSGHDANINPSTSNPASTPFSTSAAVDHYLASIPASKLILGMPLYGRAFTNTAGMGQPFQGVGSGSWENGIWDYKVLPQAGAVETTDTSDLGASWSYDSAQKLLISYDNKAVASRKTQYIQDKGLGGGMWWEASGDRTGADSLIGTVSFTIFTSWAGSVN